MVTHVNIMNDASLLGEAIKYFTEELTQAFKNNSLKTVLTKYHYPDLTPTMVDDSIGSPDGKILIIGETNCKVKDLQGIFNAMGLKGRVECHTDYEDIQRYQFNNLMYNNKYRLIIVGPMPHSTHGKDEFSSVINRMENTEGFPCVRRAIANGGLKITKTNIKQIIQKELDSGFLVA